MTDPANKPEPVSKPNYLIVGVAGVAVLLLILFLFLRNGEDVNQDRLGDAGTDIARSDPEQGCASQAVYEQIKLELFRRAARYRRTDSDVFLGLANDASIRMESPVVIGNGDDTGQVPCQGTVWLDLPPGVMTTSRRRTLTADVGYSVRPNPDGISQVLGLGNADAIVSPLATLVRIAQPEPGGDLPDPSSDPLAPLPDGGGEPLAPPTDPEPAPEPARASPSFDCDDARTSSEIAVCNSSSLAALDRQMAGQFNRALDDAGPGQRRLLQQTRNRFLGFRDRCRDNECIANTYRGRMREIGDIMAGRWQGTR